MKPRLFLGLFAGLTLLPQDGFTQEIRLNVDTPMSLPVWALLERDLLRANSAACREFFDRYLDERGFLQCVERWGGDDGQDDGIQNCDDWPILHSLGTVDQILDLYRKAWECHLRQYTSAETTDHGIPMGSRIHSVLRTVKINQ